MWRYFKFAFLLLLFGYLGILAWNWMQDGESVVPDFRKIEESSDKAKNQEEKKREKLSPLAQIHVDLAGQQAKLFSSISQGGGTITPALKTLWDRSERLYQKGEISGADAQILSALIRKMQELSVEREQFHERFQRIHADAQRTLGDHEDYLKRREFLGNEFNRQWREWIENNQKPTQVMLNSLSE